MSSDEEEDRSGLKFSFDNGVPSPSSLNNIQNDDQSAPTHHTAESQQTIHLLSFKLPFAGIPTMQAFEWWHQVNYINTISIAQKLIAGIVDDAERDYNEAISWRRNASRGDQSNAAMPEHGSTTNRTKNTNDRANTSSTPILSPSARSWARSIQTPGNPYSAFNQSTRSRSTTKLEPTRQLFSSPDSGAIEKYRWPNGTQTFIAPSKILNANGRPQFGWTFPQIGNTKNNIRRYFYCLGVMQCPVQGCNVVAKPLNPVKKAVGAEPKSSKSPVYCPAHKNLLEWRRCTGGDPSHHKKPSDHPPPCTLTTIECCDPDTGNHAIEIHHFGTHDHARPPATKPTLASIRKLEKIVKNNPEEGPAILRNKRGVKEIDPAFYNQDRVAYWRQKILRKDTKPRGIRGSIASIFELNLDIEDDFFVQVDMRSKDSNLISMQTPYMKEVLLEAASGLQSDTVEGLIHEVEFSGKCDIHFVSCYDHILCRYVPVLMSIIFGRSKTHYAASWQSLFKSYDSFTSWEEFKANFPGTTLDWSDAEGLSFVQTLLKHATEELREPELTASSVISFLRKCDVHFKRSVRKLAKNEKIVPATKEKRFRELIEVFCDEDTNLFQFERACKEMARTFPNASDWLLWHIHPDRAPHFFPACQGFTIEEQMRFAKLATSTNAQENIGRQFQHLYQSPMAVNEAILCCYKFAKSFEQDRKAVLGGLPIKYGQYVRKVEPKNRRRKWADNDGKPPRKTKRSSQKEDTGKDEVTIEDDVPHLFRGIHWGFTYVDDDENLVEVVNTCALDSLLTMLYLLHKCKIMVHSFIELENEKSILSRTFKLLDDYQGDDLGGDLARKVWLTEVKTMTIKPTAGRMTTVATIPIMIATVMMMIARNMATMPRLALSSKLKSAKH
jgi:hypothetical protein